MKAFPCLIVINTVQQITSATLHHCSLDMNGISFVLVFFYCSVPASLAMPPIFRQMKFSQCNALICIAYPWSLDDSLLGFVQTMLTKFWRARRKENDFCWFCVMIYFLLVSWGESFNIENDIRRNYAIFICLILLEGYERYQKNKAAG